MDKAFLDTLVKLTMLCALEFVPCGCSQKTDAPGNDNQKQFQEYHAKAREGDAEAQSNLGFCYETGQGVAKDYAEAVKWYRKAAGQNCAEGQSNLGFCYAHGLAGEKDYLEAVKWYRKAAEQNYAEAQSSLGACYEFGRGVPKDYEQAYAWYNLAAKTDRSAAKSRDGVMKQMLPAQVAASQKRSEQMLAQIEAQLKRGGK